MVESLNVKCMRNKTWKEKIIDVMRDKKWKTRKQINLALGLKYDSRRTGGAHAIGSYIRRLVKDGYLIRAEAPPQVCTDPRDNRNFVYRWTGKEFVLKHRWSDYQKMRDHAHEENEADEFTDDMD